MQLFLNTPRIARAFEFCVVAHRDQFYGVLPYYTHPLQVAEALLKPTEDELVAALLHDVVEDTGFGLEGIGERFGCNVACIVALVTKDSTLTYDQNIMRIIGSENRSAVKVKWADNSVNMRGDKSHMSADRQERLNKKYAKSFLKLSAILGV